MTKPMKTYTGRKAHPVEFFEKAKIIAKQLDLMSDKGYEDHPITGNEPTYEEFYRRDNGIVIEDTE